MKKLVLFDIDGTLVLTGAAGLRAMNRACADLAGHDAARERADQHAGGVGGREHAGAGLAETEGLGVVREEGRQRREEERVDEDDGAGE